MNRNSRIIVWYPFPVITPERYSWVISEYSTLRELSKIDPDTVNVLFKHQEFLYDVGFTDEPSKHLAKIEADQEQRMQSIQTYKKKLPEYFKISPSMVRIYNSTDHDVPLYELGSNDILIIVAHGCTQYMALSSKHLLLDMQHLASGLILHGLDPVDTPHILVLACNAGSICNTPGFKRYPYIYRLRDELVKNKPEFKDAYITGPAMTYNTYNLSVMSPRDKQDEMTMAEMVVIGNGFYKFVTLHKNTVTFTNSLYDTLRHGPHYSTSINNIQVPPKSEFKNVALDIEYDNRYIGELGKNRHRFVTERTRNRRRGFEVRESKDTQCKGTTRNDKRCTRQAIPGSKFCWQHQT